MIRILLADDHSIVRDGLRRIIEEAGDMAVSAEASDGHEAIHAVQSNRPDVVLMDITMPGMDGLEAVAQIHGLDPDLPILVLTMHEEEQYVVRCISAGAMGYVTKRSASEELVKAIRKVHGGGRYLTASAAEALAMRMARGKEGISPVDALSDREVQVLKRLAQGHTNREIAEAYFISIKTVDTYRLRLLQKLNLRNNSQLTRFAIQNGLIAP